jgi:hypothetical protein
MLSIRPASTVTETSLKPVQTFNLTLIMAALGASLELPTIDASILGKKALTKAGQPFTSVTGPNGVRMQAPNPAFRTEAKSVIRSRLRDRLRKKMDILSDHVSYVAQEKSAAVSTGLRSTLGHSAFVYDATYHSNGETAGVAPGTFASSLIDYNHKANITNTIKQTSSYGGSLELVCGGSSGSPLASNCTTADMLVFYQPGQLSTTAYTTAFAQNAMSMLILPIIDGKLDADGDKNLLNALNHLDEATANELADKVAQTYCADQQIAGVQFNFEGVDFNEFGQANFFRRIAMNFAGQNDPTRSGSDAFGCSNNLYPQGRLFSVLMSANHITPTVSEILNHYENGYIIDPLYDLGSNRGGTVNSPADYQRYAITEINNMINVASNLNIVYQFGIPLAATPHEFESVNGVKSGYQQIDYVRAVMAAIQTAKPAEFSYFKGLNFWAWSSQYDWQGQRFTPAQPSASVLDYLATYTTNANTSDSHPPSVPTFDTEDSESDKSTKTTVIVLSTLGGAALLSGVAALGLFACKKMHAARQARADEVEATRLNAIARV